MPSKMLVSLFRYSARRKDDVDYNVDGEGREDEDESEMNAHSENLYGETYMIVKGSRKMY